MKKNTNVPKAYAACIYTKDPILPEAFKRNNTELTELRTGTFILIK
ncbi:hypothetical protein SAMN05421866_1715 [Chryseobacterium oranimense]|jgi:hypothetical protein|uniref:Uncharacterized protein n=1 Tax=Chryseobacterium oranimense TaxID=421058 RepID=A0A1M5P8F3_9FLAO|nr:hypothetical protein [Chryseobacterium oranimense]SHG98076.1 hypothetical protein SAMN05421866_1715 [Chryseobacterium oranimense]